MSLISKATAAQMIAIADAYIAHQKRDSDTRRKAETGTGSVRSTSSAGRQASPSTSQETPTSKASPHAG